MKRCSPAIGNSADSNYEMLFLETHPLWDRWKLTCFLFLSFNFRTLYSCEMHEPEYSVVIPVYNRPQEVEEILSSLAAQTFKDFEVMVVEDGSAIRCDQVVDAYRDKLRSNIISNLTLARGRAETSDLPRQRQVLCCVDSDAFYLLTICRSLKNL